MLSHTVLNSSCVHINHMLEKGQCLISNLANIKDKKEMFNVKWSHHKYKQCTRCYLYKLTYCHIIKVLDTLPISWHIVILSKYLMLPISWHIVILSKYSMLPISWYIVILSKYSMLPISWYIAILSKYSICYL